VGGTRATDTSWTKGDEVGIYMLEEKSDGSFDYDLSKAWRKNMQYGFSLDDGAFGPVGDANKLYYPFDGSWVRFVAYYPYSSGTSSDNKITFDFTYPDQSTKADKEAKDFLFHRWETDYSKSSNGIALRFGHKFSKILMTVKKGDGVSSLSDLTVVLTNMPRTATVNLSNLAKEDPDGIVVADDVDVITPYIDPDKSSDDEVIVEAIVAPHEGGGDNFTGRTFMFTADGKSFTYKLPDDVDFESDKVYAFTFTLESSGVTQTEDGVSNCFMVKPGNTLEFPVSRA
jgi:hypothetical protein